MSQQADDERLLRRAFALARFARNRANGPYGAVFARGGTVVAEGENTEREEGGDLTCHAEIELIRRACRELAPATIPQLTLYASTEPCPMCAAAIVAAGVKRLVYGAGMARAAELTGSTLKPECRVIFGLMEHEIEVVGPLLEDEALGYL